MTRMAQGALFVLSVSLAAACANGGDLPDPGESASTANPAIDAGAGQRQVGDDGAVANDANPASDVTTADPGMEGGADASSDAPPQGADSGLEASVDAGPGEAKDSGPDAQDAMPAASVDSGFDAGMCVGGGTMEVEPNGSAATASLLSGTVCGVISPGIESDFFRFTLKPATTSFAINFTGNITLRFVVNGETVNWKSPSFPSVPFVKGVEYSVEVKSGDSMLQSYRITFTET